MLMASQLGSRRRVLTATLCAALLPPGFAAATVVVALVAPTAIKEIRGSDGALIGAVRGGLWAALDWWGDTRALWFVQDGEPDDHSAALSAMAVGCLVSAGAAVAGWLILNGLWHRLPFGVLMGSRLKPRWFDSALGAVCIGFGAGMLSALVVHECWRLFGVVSVVTVMPLWLAAVIGAFFGISWAVRARWLGDQTALADPFQPRHSIATNAGVSKKLVDWLVVGNQVTRPASEQVARLIKRAVLLFIGCTVLFSVGRVGSIVSFLRLQPVALGAGALVRPGHQLLFNSATGGKLRFTVEVGPATTASDGDSGSVKSREVAWRLGKLEDSPDAPAASRRVSLAEHEATRVTYGSALLGVSWVRWRGEVFVSVEVYEPASVEVIE